MLAICALKPLTNGLSSPGLLSRATSPLRRSSCDSCIDFPFVFVAECRLYIVPEPTRKRKDGAGSDSYTDPTHEDAWNDAETGGAT